MRSIKRFLLLLLTLAVVATPLCSCDVLGTLQTALSTATSISIQGEEQISLSLGETLQLELNLPAEVLSDVEWTSDSNCVTVNAYGLVTANKAGTAIVTATFGNRKDSVLIVVTQPAQPEQPEQPEQPGEVTTPSTPVTPEPPVEFESEYQEKYANMTADEFYANYTYAENAEDAYWRSYYGFLSGDLRVPEAAPRVVQNRPQQDGKYIRNSITNFIGEDTYVIVNSRGEAVMEIYRGGAYITLEEIAAYVYAFGDVPANYDANKKARPSSSIWGEYLRVNNTVFSGDTRKYPYEPALPNISGCGGELTYYEIDIGTTGTDTGNGYAVGTYNDGSRITRGAARIVYARYDRNGDRIIDPNERYVFYTYNHYNDFQEYLNYYGGWGDIFGNVTGGGTLSSKYDCNPTPYIEVALAPLPNLATAYMKEESAQIIYFFCPIIDTKVRAA